MEPGKQGFRRPPEEADLYPAGEQNTGREGPPSPVAPAAAYSTVTLLARLRGWSMSVPLITATW